nr:hypothetical protein [Candidatus Krumholzibacteria bacterium]
MRDLSWPETEQFETLAYGRFDLSSDGRIAFATERDSWAVAVGNLQGEGEIWRRPLPGTPRTSAEREAIREEMNASDLGQVSKHHPVIGRVRWRPSGHLWVEPWGVDPPPGHIASFDEFAKDGQLLRRVHIAAAFQPEHGHLQIINDGHLVWFEGFGYGDTTFEGQPKVYLLEVSEANAR